MEYYLASKRKEILRHGTVWLNLEDIVLLGEKVRSETRGVSDREEKNGSGDGWC